jgi:hypothetical protein
VLLLLVGHVWADRQAQHVIDALRDFVSDTTEQGATA